MAPAPCHHSEIRRLIREGQPLAGLRMAGAMLAADPGDAMAWFLGAVCLAGLGDDEGAATNLKNAIPALARIGQPLAAIGAALEWGDRAGDRSRLLTAIARLYAAGSDRLAETAPPKIPVAVASWDTAIADVDVVDKAKEQMAVAWGQDMASRDIVQPLPRVLLFSSLDADAFTALAGCFTPRWVSPGERILSQGDDGDAMYAVAQGVVEVTRTDRSGNETRLALVGAGGFFGEMAILSRVPRAAGVSAVEHTLVLRSDVAVLEELAGRMPRVADELVAFGRARMLDNLVRTSPVLRPLPPAQRARVLERFASDWFAAGSTILEEGAPGKGLFLLVSGRVSVRRMMDGQVTQVARLAPGDVFGEISLLQRRPSGAAVVADENAAVLHLDAEAFHGVIDEFPALLKGVYDIALERERKNNSILGQPALAEDGQTLI